MVTELEKEHAMNGNFNQLVEHQRKIDEERDAQVMGYPYSVFLVCTPIVYPSVYTL